MGMHSGKAKEEQLGWLGKQWGIWNRHLLEERELVCLTVGRVGHWSLLRGLRRLEIAERKRHWKKLSAIATRSDREMLEVALAARSRCHYWRHVDEFFAIEQGRSMKAREQANRICRRGAVRLHRGNLQRLMKGDLADRLTRWAASMDLPF
jgi:hypothetical protein